MMVNCRKNNPFTCKKVNYQDILDFRNWWTSSDENAASEMLKLGISMETFAISQHRQFVYDSSSPGFGQTSEINDGFVFQTSKLPKQKNFARNERI